MLPANLTMLDITFSHTVGFTSLRKLGIVDLCLCADFKVPSPHSQARPPLAVQDMHSNQCIQYLGTPLRGVSSLGQMVKHCGHRLKLCRSSEGPSWTEGGWRASGGLGSSALNARYGVMVPWHTLASKWPGIGTMCWRLTATSIVADPKVQKGSAESADIPKACMEDSASNQA